MIAPLSRAGAVMAHPDPCTLTQPDGSKVTLRLHGDEFFSYTLTSDGYQVIYNDLSRAWEYATLSSSGELISTGMMASDNRIVPGLVKGLRNRPTQAQLDMMKARRVRARLKTGQYDYEKFRGLVILVEYNDAPFSRDDIRQVVDEMVNKPGYDGYMTNNLLPSKVEYTGSVRDYYYENSGGVFDPKFDVVGPVKINYSQHFARKTSGAQSLVSAALHAADPEVDYSLYDTDGNRQVDMVYFIFSGGGSNFSGNDETLIWPHASTVMSVSLDGVSFGRYACSTELYGPPSGGTLDGIGTICHEFSHVLGLPDLYDVDYETGGQSVHPAKWSVMASGSYLNKSRTPCGYSLYERYSLGFASPRLISAPGDYTVSPLNSGDTPDGCRINSVVENEFFLLESRVKTRWDEYLPGAGLLVHRVDSTDVAVWENNRVNATPQHTYYTLLRATPKPSGSSVADSDGDPFPGSGNVTSITNATTPSMRSWTMNSTPLVLEDIAVAADGSVSFKVVADDVPTLMEDFSTMPATAIDTTGVMGRFTAWNFLKGARIVWPDESDHGALTTVKGAEVESGKIDATIENVSLTITNPTSSNAIFRLYSSVDGGATWRPVSTIEGTANPSVKRGEKMVIHYNTGELQNPALRIVQYTGHASSSCTINRFELSIKPGSGTAGIVPVISDAGAADCPVVWYNILGHPVAEPSVPGLYIKVTGDKAEKIIKR